MLEVRLFPGLPGGRWARLKPITGAIEEALDPGDPAGFGHLLNRLLSPTEGTTVGPGSAFDLALADHDRLAAALYCEQFGDRMESTVRCPGCRSDYDVSFSLGETIAMNSPEILEGIHGMNMVDGFRTRDGSRFRLPTLHDRLATLDLPPDEARQELARRCLDGPPADGNLDAIEEAMEEVGPLISGLIAAECPHCNRNLDSLPFSMQHFLLDALAFDRRFLPREIHSLARAYGWSRREILEMPLHERREHVRMILAEAAVR